VAPQKGSTSAMSNATTNYTAMAAAMQSDLSAATTDNGASAPVQGIVNFLNGNNAPPSNSTLLPISNSDIIRSTLRFWGSLYLAAVVVFCFLRRFYPKLFDLRSWVEEMKCDTAKNAEYGWVNWLWKVFYVDDDELMNSCGMDATCFLRALRFGRRLSYIGCINAIWLLPLYVTAPQSAETFYITDPLVVASLSHLSTGSKRFLGTVIAAYITFVFSMFLIVNEFQWFAKYRHKFLALRIPQNYAVYVSGIPEGLQSSSELHKYFEQGVDVLEAHIAMNIPNLEAKVARRENIVRRLEHAMALEKKTGTVKTHRKLSKRGAIEKVETVPKLEEKLRKLNRSIAVETGKIMNSHDPRRRMLSRQDRSKKLSTVFVDEMRTTGTRNIVEEVDEDEMDNELTAILRGRPEEEALERQDFEESSEGAFGVQDVDVEAVTIAYRSGSNGSLDPIVEAVGENNSEKEECESLESDSDRLHVAEEACLPVSLDENYDAPVFATVCVKSGAISAAGTESEEPNHDRVALTSHIPKGEFRTCKAASSSYCAERSVEKEIEAGSDADDQGSCKYSGCFRKDIDHAGDPTTDTLDQSNYLVCDTKRPASSSTALSTDLEDGLMDAKTFHHASNVHSDNLSSQNFLKQKAKEFVVENKVCNGEVPRPAIFDSASSAEHLGTMMSFEGKFLNESSSETLTRTSGSLPFLSLHEHSLSDMPGNLIQTDSLFIDAWEFAPEPVEGPDDALMIETAPDQSNTQNHLTFHGDPRRRFLPALSSSSSISSGKDRRKSLRQSFVPVSKVVTAGSRVASSTMVTAGSTVLRSSRAATNSVTKAVSVGSRVAGASVVTAGSTVKKGSLAAGGAIVRVAQDAHVDKLIHHAGEKGIKTATAIGTHLVTSAATVVPVLAANQSGEPRDAGFVVFKTLYSTQLALQMIHHPRPFTMDVQEAPDPADIFWRNVGMPHRARRTGRILSIGATAALCVFWSIPTAAIASLAQVNSLKASLPRLGELLDRRPGLDHFMELLAPLLLLILNQTVLPAILKYFATWEGHVSSGILESSVCLKLGAFTVRMRC